MAKNNSQLSRAHRLIRVVFGLCAAFLLVCVGFLWAPTRAQEQGSTAPKESANAPVKSIKAIPLVGQNSEPKIVELERQLRDLEGRTHELDRILGYERERLALVDSTSRFLVSGAGIFALLLGLGSWKIVEDQAKAGKERFEQQLSTLRELKDELERDFPMFGRMRSNFVRILADLRSACAPLTPEDDTFGKLGWEDRQRILFYEKTVADTLLLGAHEHSKELSEIFRLLGIFYGSRYLQHWHKDHAVPKDDQERSRFYFDLAIEHGPDIYSNYATAGHFMMDYTDRSLAVTARSYFRQAATLGESKQKPLVNLAFLELHAFANPDACLHALDDAGSRKEWDAAGSLPKPQMIIYTRACALATKASASERTESREAWEKAVHALEEAALNVDVWIKTSFLEKEDGRATDKELFQGVTGYSDLSVRFEKAAEKIELSSFATPTQS